MEGKRTAMRPRHVIGLVAILMIVFGMIVPVAMADQVETELAWVSVYHGINGKSAAARLLGDPESLTKELPVNVFVNGFQVSDFDDLTFKQTRGPFEWPARTYTITVRLDAEVPADGLEVLSEDVTLPEGAHVLLWVKMKGNTPDLQTKIIK